MHRIPAGRCVRRPHPVRHVRDVFVRQTSDRRTDKGARQAQQSRNHPTFRSGPLTNWKIVPGTFGPDQGRGGIIVSANAILENVRRYRTIASLYRQTAAFRPLQRHSLLEEAERWEHLALSELEVYFSVHSSPRVHEQSVSWSYRGERRALAVAA
jgi:hypothetical protein